MGRVAGILALVVLVSCGKAQTAMDVCHKLEAAGVASNCKPDTASGLGAAAIEKVSFDLRATPGKGGQVLRFESAQNFDSTVNAFAKAAALAGPHRYGSQKARIFVQLNDHATADAGKHAKAVVDAL